MLSLIERGESSPAAVVLEKLATGLHVTLPSLFDAPKAAAQAPSGPVARREDQPQWQDPDSGYIRRNVSPPKVPQPMQIVEVHFPPGARVAFETGARDQSRRTAQTGHYILERLAGPRVDGLWRVEGTGRRARRNQIDAHGCRPPEAGRWQLRASPHHFGSEATGLPEIKSGNWSNAVLRASSCALPKVRVQKVLAVRWLS